MMTHCPSPGDMCRVPVSLPQWCGDEQSGDGAADQTTVITVGGAVGLAQATADAVWVVTALLALIRGPTPC